MFVRSTAVSLTVSQGDICMISGAIYVSGDGASRAGKMRVVVRQCNGATYGTNLVPLEQFFAGGTLATTIPIECIFTTNMAGMTAIEVYVEALSVVGGGTHVIIGPTTQTAGRLMVLRVNP
jgi:hypothetical protein